MIGFGELRKRSLEWGVDLGVVEQAYATDWLIKGIFDHPVLAQVCILRGSAILRWAYPPAAAETYPTSAAGYPPFGVGYPAPEFFVRPEGPAVTPALLDEALRTATAASGVRFAPATVRPGLARVAFTGPLGRRSAAQPQIALTLATGRPLLPPHTRPLVHPFGDPCPATVAAQALDEFVAERMAGLARPRVRDLYDLWLAVTQHGAALDPERVRALLPRVAHTRPVPLPPAAAGPLWDAAQRARLAQAWDAALRDVLRRPAWTQVENDLIHIRNHYG